MARTPQWFGRLDAIRDAVRQAPPEWPLGQPELKTLFAVSARDAWRLLERFGARSERNQRFLAPAALLGQLEELRQSAPYLAFRRREQVKDQAAAAAKPEQAARRCRIAGTLDFAGGLTLADLPADIALAPGKLTVTFRYEEDLWWLLDTLGNIAAQDRRGFRERIEPADP
jgi:hypothetical protein